jgi:hypothetical protein
VLVATQNDGPTLDTWSDSGLMRVARQLLAFDGDYAFRVDDVVYSDSRIWCTVAVGGNGRYEIYLVRVQ